ncbi:hypothetical protein HDV63DRAFT_15577 [Trichoderma sp. SZMC 28014]
MLLLMRQLCFSLSRVLYCVCSSLNYCPPTSVSPKAQPFHSPYTSQYHWNYNYLAAAQISQQNCMGRFIAVDCRSQLHVLANSLILSATSNQRYGLADMTFSPLGGLHWVSLPEKQRPTSYKAALL